MLTNDVLRVKCLLTTYCSKRTSVQYHTKTTEGGAYDLLAITRALRTDVHPPPEGENSDRGGGEVDRSPGASCGRHSAKAGY